MTPAGADAARFAADLIRIDTTNRGGGDAQERPAAEYVAARLAEAGLEPVLLESAPGRANVVARIGGAGSAGTTSRCPCSRRAPSPSVPSPPIRATTFARPGADSSSTGSSPASASRAATYSAAGRSCASPPPRLVVSILIRSTANRAASAPAGVIAARPSARAPTGPVRPSAVAPARPRGRRRRSAAW